MWQYFNKVSQCKARDSWLINKFEKKLASLYVDTWPSETFGCLKIMLVPFSVGCLFQARERCFDFVYWIELWEMQRVRRSSVRVTHRTNEFTVEFTGVCNRTSMFIRSTHVPIAYSKQATYWHTFIPYSQDIHTRYSLNQCIQKSRSPSR